MPCSQIGTGITDTTAKGQVGGQTPRVDATESAGGVGPGGRTELLPVLPGRHDAGLTVRLGHQNGPGALRRDEELHVTIVIDGAGSDRVLAVFLDEQPDELIVLGAWMPPATPATQEGI